MRKTYAGFINASYSELDMVKLFFGDLISSEGYYRKYLRAESIFEKNCPGVYYEEYLLNNFIDFKVEEDDTVVGPCVEDAWAFYKITLTIDFEDLFGSISADPLKVKVERKYCNHARIKGYKSCNHLCATGTRIALACG